MEAIPKIGNKHSFFDDGKRRESRHHIAEVLSIITTEGAKNTVIRKDGTTLYDIWQEEVKDHVSSEYVSINNTKPGEPWLYATETDFFVACLIPTYDDDTIWFVRDINGGWFSLNTTGYWQSGQLMPVEFNAELYFLQQQLELERWISEKDQRLAVENTEYEYGHNVDYTDKSEL